MSQTSDSSEVRYPRIAVEVDAQGVDELSAYLFELGALGVEERDDDTLEKPSSAGHVLLLASFSSEADADEAFNELKADFTVRYDHVIGDAWRDAWKEGFHPFHLTDRIVIRPPWEEYQASEGDLVLCLEPGRAFGTGLHATTALVAASIEAHAEQLRGKSVLDVGCGTSILAIIALALGASHARAVDNDPDVVAVSLENAQRNDFEGKLHVDATDVSKLTEVYPFVVANIEARVLIPLAKAIMARVSSGGLLVLSGVLAEQENDVVSAYKDFAHEATRHRDEWVSIELRSP